MNTRSFRLLCCLALLTFQPARADLAPDWSYPLPGPDWVAPYELANNGLSVSADGQTVDLLVPDIGWLRRIRRSGDQGAVEHSVQHEASVYGRPRVVAREPTLLLANPGPNGEFGPYGTCRLQRQRADLSLDWTWESGYVLYGDEHCHHVAVVPDHDRVVTASRTRVLVLDGQGQPSWERPLADLGGSQTYLQRLVVLSGTRLLLLGWAYLPDSAVAQSFAWVLDAQDGRTVALTWSGDIAGSVLAVRNLPRAGVEVLVRIDGQPSQHALLRFSATGALLAREPLVLPDFQASQAVAHADGFYLVDQGRELVLRLDSSIERWRVVFPGVYLAHLVVAASGELAVGQGSNVRRISPQGQLQPALILPAATSYPYELHYATNGRLWLVTVDEDYGSQDGEVWLAAYEPGETQPASTLRISWPLGLGQPLAFDAQPDGGVRQLTALRSAQAQVLDSRLVGTTLSAAGKVLAHFDLAWPVDSGMRGFALQQGWIVLGPDPAGGQRLAALAPGGQILWQRQLPELGVQLACNRGSRCVLQQSVEPGSLELFDFSGAVLSAQAPLGQLLIAATDGQGLQGLRSDSGQATLLSLDPLPAQALTTFTFPGPDQLLVVPLGDGLLQFGGATLQLVRGTAASWSRQLPGPFYGLSTQNGRLHVVTGAWSGPLSLSTLDAASGNLRRTVALPARYNYVQPQAEHAPGAPYGGITVSAASDDLDWMLAYDGSQRRMKLLALDDTGVRQHIAPAEYAVALRALPGQAVLIQTYPSGPEQLNRGALERYSLPLFADGFEAGE